MWPAMNRRLPLHFALSASLCASLVAGTESAEAAAVQGRATAIIAQGVSMRSPNGQAQGAAVQLAGAETSLMTRNVQRPCRPGDPETATCRMVLLEMQ